MPQLTPRELEVVRLLCSGLTSSAELAERLCITTATVDYHVAVLRSKFAAHDRAQIVAYAYSSGLVDPAA